MPPIHLWPGAKSIRGVRSGRTVLTCFAQLLREANGPSVADEVFGMSAISQCLSTTFRPAVLSDHPQIVGLESRYGLGTRSYEAWSHLWLANPAYRARPGWPIGWVVQDTDGRVVASLGNLPLDYTLEGKRILACSGRGLVAEPAYRSACLMLLDRLINQSSTELYLNNTVGPEAIASFQLFECPRVPLGVWDQAAFWVTNYRAFFAAVARPVVRGAAGPLSYALSAAAYLRDRLRATALREGDVEVQACTAFDDRFDDFWDSLKERFPRLLLAVRTRETLEWHFKYALLKNRLWIATISDASRLAAYAVFEKKDPGGALMGLRRMRLVDFQSLDGGAALLSPILSWALRRCRQEGIHLLENVGRWLESGELVHFAAPYRRRLPTWTYFYRASSPGLARSLADGRSWAPSLYDGDATL